MAAPEPEEDIPMLLVTEGGAADTEEAMPMFFELWFILPLPSPLPFLWWWWWCLWCFLFFLAIAPA
jgi:hypothetical protein